MAIASGTCGTCSWTIADDGSMTIGAGTLHAPWLPGIMNCGWPWGDHVKDITSCMIRTGVIVGKQEALMGGYIDDYVTTNMFYGCSNMTSLTFEGTFDTSNVTDMSGMFFGCSSLTSLNLSPVNTSRVQDMGIMFAGCSLLTSVTFGPLFNTLSLTDTMGLGFAGYDFPSVKNQTGSLIVTSDADFRALTPAQHAGTWTRSASGVTFRVSAVRTDAGQADEDGEDVTIQTTWLTGSSTTTRNLTVYMKKATESLYPSDPVAAKTLSGNSGTDSLTIEGIGDEAFDFKVEFYDGTDTYIAFPAVASNIRLITIDEDGVPSCHNMRGDFGTIFELIYPVGAIYMSTVDVSPQVLFGGTWEQIENRFLLAAGSSYAAGATDGEATHKLTVAEMPSHTHVQNQHRHGMGEVWSDGTGSSSAYMKESKRKLTTRSTAYATPTNQNTGGGGAHNNMPPYLAVYVWKRTE